MRRLKPEDSKEKAGFGTAVKVTEDELVIQTANGLPP